MRVGSYVCIKYPRCTVVDYDPFINSFFIVGEHLTAEEIEFENYSTETQFKWNARAAPFDVGPNMKYPGWSHKIHTIEDKSHPQHGLVYHVKTSLGPRKGITYYRFIYPKTYFEDGTYYMVEVGARPDSAKHKFTARLTPQASQEGTNYIGTHFRGYDLTGQVIRIISREMRYPGNGNPEVTLYDSYNPQDNNETIFAPQFEAAIRTETWNEVWVKLRHLKILEL